MGTYYVKLKNQLSKAKGVWHNSRDESVFTRRPTQEQLNSN